MTVEYERIYIRFKGRVLGPLTHEKTLDLVRRGQITKQHELSPDGLAWKPAEEFGSLFRSEHIPSNRKAQELNEPAVPDPVPEQWYANFDGANQGPVGEQSLKKWIAQGSVLADTLVWRPGMQDWIAIGTLRPEWFPSASLTKKTPTASESTSIPEGTNDLTWFASEQLRTLGWVQFLAITGLIVGTAAVIGSIAWFFLIATRDGSGPIKVMAVIVSLSQVATALSFFFAALLLLNYSSRLSVLKYRAEAKDLVHATVCLNRFWKFTGVVVMIWLIVTSLLLSIVYLLGLSIPTP